MPAIKISELHFSGINDNDVNFHLTGVFLLKYCLHIEFVNTLFRRRNGVSKPQALIMHRQTDRFNTLIREKLK